MGIINTGISAIGKLVALGTLIAAFGVGLTAVVYVSLSGTEIKVPEIVGKDFVESERELASLGLKIKRRADRPSSEKVNTVLEQLPKAGETVKTGQLILVVVSKEGTPSGETPKSLIKDIEADDTKKIEEMISDKPKRARSSSNANSAANNSQSKADTTRDTIANTSKGDEPSSTRTDGSGETSDKDKKEPVTGDKIKSENPINAPAKPKASPNPVKPATSDQRPRIRP